MLVFLGTSASSLAQGDGPRMCWKTLADGSAVKFKGVNASDKTNHLDPAHVVEPSNSFAPDLARLGHHCT